MLEIVREKVLHLPAEAVVRLTRRISIGEGSKQNVQLPLEPTAQTVGKLSPRPDRLRRADKVVLPPVQLEQQLLQFASDRAEFAQ